MKTKEQKQLIAKYEKWIENLIKSVEAPDCKDADYFLGMIRGYRDILADLKTKSV